MSMAVEEGVEREAEVAEVVEDVPMRYEVHLTLR
jgi:hypothetical protein